MPVGMRLTPTRTKAPKSIYVLKIPIETHNFNFASFTHSDVLNIVFKNIMVSLPEEEIALT